ncbi:hypothetical protein BLOT_001371, partial [Blomia tropicalis]
MQNLSITILSGKDLAAMFHFFFLLLLVWSNLFLNLIYPPFVTFLLCSRDSVGWLVVGWLV